MELSKRILIGLVGLIIIYLWSLETKADNYTPYLKVGVGYNVDSQDTIEYKPAQFKRVMYGGNRISYNIESGIIIPTETGNALHLGIYWYDLLDQDEDGKQNHRPYKFEVFSDYAYQWDDHMFVKVGVGYKIFEQTDVHFNYNYNSYDIDTGSNILDKITARLAIGRQWSKYSLSLEHHSQWLKGKPFNNEWEYHVTSVSLGYTF